MRKILLLILPYLFSIHLHAQNSEVKRFTLEQCINYALQNNYTTQTMELNEESREASYKQSKSERLPDLSASVSENFSHVQSGGSSWGGNYGMNTGVVLYNGGVINNNIEQTRLEKEQTTYQSEQYKNELTINVLEAFLTVIANEELIKYLDFVLQASEEQLKQGTEQFKVGSLLESDYLMLKAQVAADKNNIAETKISIEKSLLSLKSLLSIDPKEKLEVVSPDTTAIKSMGILPSQETVIERAMAYLPDLKISEYDINLAQVGVKTAQAGYMPSVSLSAGVGTGHANNYKNFGTQLSDRLNEQVGLSVSIPIFSNNRNKTKVAQSKIALKQAELSQKQTELTIKQSINTDYYNIVSAYNNYITSEIKQNAYQKTYDVYGKLYNAGTITTVDLLQQQNNYISTLNDYIQNKYGFMLKRKILDVYMGLDIIM